MIPLETKKNRHTKKEYLTINPEAWDKILEVDFDKEFQDDFPLFSSLLDHIKNKKTMDEWVNYLDKNYIDQYFLNYEAFEANDNTDRDHDLLVTVTSLKFLSDKEQAPSLFLQDGIEINDIKKYIKLLMIIFNMERFYYLGIVNKYGTYEKYSLEGKSNKVSYKAVDGITQKEDENGNLTITIPDKSK
jgi:hypothetical protein